MPETELLSHVETNASSEVVRVRETRFDPPHEVARGEIEYESEHANQPLSSPLGMVNAAALDIALAENGEGIAVEVIQQFRLQAQQLAGHLETRQQELDRREAELNAHLAQHETSTRNARLWFQEQHHDLEDRKTEVERREQLLAAQVAELTESAADGRSVRQAVAQFQQDSTANVVLQNGAGAIHELELRRRQIELDDLAKQLAEAEQELEESRRKLSDRQTELEKSEGLLARGYVELEDARSQLETEREEVQARLDEQRRKLAVTDERQQIEFKKQREAIANRSQFLERRSASLDQLRAELLRLQRETLEMRLATEELWSQLSGSVPPATVTQSLARLRAKLAEHYRLQAADIAAQRKDLEELAAKVTQQHQQVAAQKRELDVWITHQQSEIESQAARLVAREEELDREQDRNRQQRTQWDSNRRKLEAEIRGLQNEARHAEAECVGVE